MADATAQIFLSNGTAVLVDALDHAWLSQWKWWQTSDGYAARQTGGKGNVKHILMHRMIMDMPSSLIDHINRDKVDNRRANLRITGTSQNVHNTGLRSTNTSGHKGVSWNKRKNLWRAYIGISMDRIELGHFSSLEEAICARAQAEERFGVECGFIT